MTRSAEQSPVTAPHPLDFVSLGKIVQIRERLMTAQANGKAVFRFESGDPSFSPPAHVAEALVAATYAGKTHYIPNNGIPELRAALAEKARVKNGLTTVTSDDVFVTNGAMHALNVTFGALLMPGDEVIIPDPMWTEVAENIRLAGGVTIGVKLSAEEDFAYRAADIEAAITPKTTAIFINTPQNPTGALLSREELQAIYDVARRHNLWIVSDEAYEDLVFEPHQHVSIGSLAEANDHRVISIFSFSKSHAMSGLRTGYVITRAELLKDRLPKLLRCTINGVNSVAQWAALAAVTGSQASTAMMRNEYRVRRDIMIAALTGIPGVRPFTPKGTFFVWVELDPSVYDRLEVADADALSSSLAADGIGSAPGDAFGTFYPDAIRFSFSCDTTMVREGSIKLREALL
ncbi:MAG: Aspartate aminotransferase [Gemmatimonadetes bacterium]|nr:Aspartate aminotransferase [Gemmatimonadota bacterium]